MNVIYQNDLAGIAGYGFFLVAGLTPLSSLEGLSFSLKRASDQKNLSAAGWQETESFQTPLAVERTPNELKLHVGPAVVDQLDVQESYRFFLRASGWESTACPLLLHEVRYSPLAGGQGVGIATPPPLSAPAQPTVEPTPEILPPVADSLREPATKYGTLLLLTVLLLALLAGGGVYYFLSPDKQASAQAESAPPPLPKAETPLIQARKHLAGPANSTASLHMALEFRSKPDGADAAFLLVEDAAAKGNAKAMLELASFYDPLDKNPNGTIEKDPPLAWAWYKKAEVTGETAAQDKCAALRAWAEAEAPKGSEAAKKILMSQ